MENRFILREMGSLRGKRLLDIGAGLGESSVYFALRGAEVTCTDISPGMIKRALELARLHGVQIRAITGPAESLELPENYYDIVHIANVIHHVTNKDALFNQVRRVLKQRGRFFTLDPLAYNPVINIYRRMATAVRSEDETPLTFHDIALARKYFSNVRHREFWIATLALFLKYYFVDGVHPNEDRYWRRIFNETPGRLFWWQPLRAMDAVLTRLPLVRRLAWNIVMWGEKPIDRADARIE
jgi:SAM-dependent methyltransferase